METKEDPKEVIMIRSVLIFAGALLLGAGVVACGSDDDTSDVPSGVTSTLEAFTEATNTYDSEALGALVTDDFTWQSTGDVQSRTEYLAYFDTYYEDLEFNVESTSQLTIGPDGDAYVAEQTDIVTSNAAPDMTGREVLRLVEVDGSWLIQEFRWTQYDAS
jgi:hypothetical protein